ncbi:putative RNA recognition motif domain, nucleotide-binding alpha-beta plait domain superfamily [Helianthus debilis subsp. tardiflorus]
MFIYNLPPKCSSVDLVQVLKGYGNIQGTYIARKYDKLGKRFGFVSFGNVKDPETLENNLKDVWIGSYKLFISTARFVDETKVQEKVEKVWRPVQDQTVERNDHVDPDPKVVCDKPGPSNVAGRTFKDTLLDIEPVSGTVEISAPDDLVCCNDWYDLGLLGRLIDFKSLTDLRSWFLSSINKNITIKYLGGFYVIVLFESVEDKQWFFDKKNLWESVFSSLEDWEGQIFDFERIAWIKVYGIPMCLMTDSVLKDIGNSVGEVVQPSSLNDSDDLSYVFMGVLCNSVNRIHRNVQLIWKSKSFPITIEEDPGDWVPDCLDDIDVDDPSDNFVSDDIFMAEQEITNAEVSVGVGERNLEGAENEESSQQPIPSPIDGGIYDCNNGGNSVTLNDNIPECQLDGDFNVNGICLNKKVKGFKKKSRKKLSVSQ